MPVTTTAREVAQMAFAKSRKNVPGVTALDPEVLQVVIRAMRGLYTYAGSLNPGVFAESADVAYDASAGVLGWPRPLTAESVFHLERVDDGSRVYVVPMEDRALAIGKGSVYEWGGVFRTAIAGAEPTTARALRMFYARRPTVPADLDAVLDALWLEQFNELLALETAIYLSLKDERADVDTLVGERDKWLELFDAYLEHATVGVLRRFPPRSLRAPYRRVLASGTPVSGV